MLEPTPTLGSTEASPYERRQLARASLRFNLESAQFCGLFPAEAAVMRRTLRGAAEEGDAAATATAEDDEEEEDDDDEEEIEEIGSDANDGDVRRGQPQHRAATNRQRRTAPKAGTAAAAAAAVAAAAIVKPVQRGRERRERQRAEKAALAAGATIPDGPAAEARAATATAAEDWRTVGANVAVLAAFAVFVALAVHVIRSLGDD